MARVTAVFAVAVMLLCIFPAVCADAEEGAPQTDELLIDYGNGHTEWMDLPEGHDSFRSLFDAALGDRIEYMTGSGITRVLSVDGVRELDFGSNKNSFTCSWRIYWWNSVSWEHFTDDVDERYVDGCIALGFYSDGSVMPVSNPEYKEVWTSYKGDSASSGVSLSFGPESVANPLEWAVTYPGPVDCNILYADGMIYHTVAGKYGSVGMDAKAWINCLDPVNKDVLWSVAYSKADRIEITTPVIVGDMIIVTSGNWHVYCLDRFSGEPIAELVPKDRNGDLEEADMCKGSAVTGYIPRKDVSFGANDKDLVESGVSNAVYDSGALYFCTSDGYVRCFTIDRENGFKEVWAKCPDEENRGTFYFHPPVVCDVDGVRCVVSGNYAGSMFCVRADNGEHVWTRSVQDTAEKRVGSVSSINPCQGGNAVVTYTNGRMNASSGGIMLIDLTDGHTIWQHDVLTGYVTVHEDKFYTNVIARSGDTVISSQTGEEVPLNTGYCAFWTYDSAAGDCTMLWNRATDAPCKGGQTYCDGRLYSMDYSPGTEGAVGGAVWCLEADTGDIAWRVTVKPYSGGSYSMCTPTVVDGKVLVSNDYGAVYVLSETSGNANSITADINYQSQGLKHWSWIFTIIVAAGTILAAALLYKRW